MSSVSDKLKRELEHIVTMSVSGAINRSGLTSEQISSQLHDIMKRTELRSELEEALAGALSRFFSSAAA